MNACDCRYGTFKVGSTGLNLAIDLSSEVTFLHGGYYMGGPESTALAATIIVDTSKDVGFGCQYGVTEYKLYFDTISANGLTAHEQTIGRTYNATSIPDSTVVQGSIGLSGTYRHPTITT